MTDMPALIEPSFAEAIAFILGASELPEQTRRHWATSLRQIAKALDKPLEVIPARYSGVRAELAQLHEVPAGLTPKTLRNHKSNTKSALCGSLGSEASLSMECPWRRTWQVLVARIRHKLVRLRLSALMRFCSANGIGPEEVDESVVQRFLEYRARIGNRQRTRFDVSWRARGM